MADCSKTVEFFKEHDRMCDSIECEDCPIYRDNNGKREHCEEFCAKYADEAVQILQAWSDSHPAQKPKTYADDFFERFPKASKSYLTQKDYESGIAFPTAKRCHIYGIGFCCCMEDDCTREMQARCWNEPYEESETNG